MTKNTNLKIISLICVYFLIAALGADPYIFLFLLIVFGLPVFILIIFQMKHDGDEYTNKYKFYAFSFLLISKIILVFLYTEFFRLEYSTFDLFESVDILKIITFFGAITLLPVAFAELQFVYSYSLHYERKARMYSGYLNFVMYSIIMTFGLIVTFLWIAFFEWTGLLNILLDSTEFY